MKKLLSLSLASCLTLSSQAVVLSAWTFETNTPADLANSTTGPSVVAESGIFTTGYTAFGVHASALTDWTTPAGYSSTNGYSSTDWTVGDYYQFSSSSDGYEDITVSFGQVSSNTGPAEFRLEYSTNGTSFTVAGNYLVLANAGNNQWSNGSTIANTSYSFDLSGITALDDQATIVFRLAVYGTADAAPPGAFVAGGTSRVDNFTVNGVAIVPEPGAALLGSLGLLGLVRRRRN
jgi:MYXO-CTERM domain-containing protein